MKQDHTRANIKVILSAPTFPNCYHILIFIYFFQCNFILIRDLSEISRGGGGWSDDGTLKKQCVAILNKYTDHYQLPLVRDKKKPEKLRAIIKHLIEQRNNEDESDDDIVFNKLENQVMHHIFGLFI